MRKLLIIALWGISFAGFAQSDLSTKLRNKDSGGRGLSKNDLTNTLFGKLSQLPDTNGIIHSRQTPAYLSPFVGEFIPAYLKKFIVNIEIIRAGNQISATIADTIHIENVRRAKSFPGPPAFTRSTVALGKNGVRITTWFRDNYVEPAPDAFGNIYDTFVTSAEPGQGGVQARITVNWAALPLNSEYAFVTLKLNGRLNPLVYGQGGLPAGVTKSTIPTTAIPRTIYTVLNDIDSRNTFTTASVKQQDLVRNYGLNLYVDKFLRGTTVSTNFPLNTDVRWDETGTDKIRIYSPRKGDGNLGLTTERTTDHATPSETIARSFIINGGTNYNNKTVAFTQKSTRESTGSTTLVKLLTIGESTVAGLNTEVGVLDGYAKRSWAVVREQMEKARIDYLLEQGWTPTQITNNAITTADSARYKMINIGTVVDPTAVDNFTINYRGVTATYALEAEGRGSWDYYMYLNKPQLMQRSQGLWDALGLGNGTGADYTGSAAQTLLIDRTAWTPNNAIDTPAMRAWALSQLGITQTTLAQYKTAFANIENDPVNPFYDKDKVTTYNDSQGNVWTVRFSIAKYLQRWRTMTDAGARLAPGSGSLGTKITSDRLTLDVTLPNFIIMQSCQNAGNVAHFGRMAKIFADAVKAEYTTNGWGTVNIGLSIIDGAGTFFPKLYPTIPWSEIDPFQRSVHDDNGQRLLTEITNEDANRVFALINAPIIPTANSIVWRAGNTPEYDLTGDEDDRNYIASRTSTGIKAHINGVGNRPLGIHFYAWIKYVLGL